MMPACSCPFCFEEFEPSQILFQETLYDSRLHSDMDQRAEGAGSPTSALVYGVPRVDTQYQNFMNRFQHVLTLEKRHILYKIDTGDIAFDAKTEDASSSGLYAASGDIAQMSYNAAYVERPVQEKSNNRDGYGLVTDWEDEAKTIPRVMKKYRDGGHCFNKVCPNCHCSIPMGYLTARPENIQSVALLGGTSAGKTQYMVATLQDLENNLDYLGYGQMEIADESRFFFDILSEQFEEKGRPDATGKDRPLFPMMIVVTPTYTGMLSDPAIVVFYDIPGEYANNPQIMLDQERGLKTAQTLMYVVDPHQIPNWALNDTGDMFNRSLSAPLMNLARFNYCQAVQRVAVVVTKADYLISSRLLKPNSSMEFNDGDAAYMDDMKMHHGGVDRKTLNAIHNNIEFLIEGRHFYYEWENKIASFVNPRIREEEKRQEQEKAAQESRGGWWRRGRAKRQEKAEPASFHTTRPSLPVRFFAVSTHQWITEGGERKLVECRVRGKFRHRIVEPVLWLLAEWGVIPYKQEPDTHQ